MDHSELDRAEAELWERLIGALRRSSKAHAAIKVVLILGGAVVGAIGGAMEGGIAPSQGDGLVTLKGLLVALGALGAFAGGVLLLIADWETPDLLDLAKRFVREAKDYLLERDELLKLDDKRRALLEMQSDIYEACENLGRDEPLKAVARAILAVGSVNLNAAIGFEPGERWAFSVFQRVKLGEDEVMKRVAVQWAERDGESKPGRNWKIREGFTGWAWADAEDLIVGNANDPEWNGKYAAPEDKKIGSDAERYVSAAAIPIKVGATDEIWGVVTATSNFENRFKRNPQDVRSQNVDTVRVLARLIATQVALRSP